MRVAVLGGGLQGACVAMELASAGVDVDLFDKNDRCVTQASAQNEGKIHLGYVYANDRSLSTARTMIRGAVAFASSMRRWIGDEIDAIPVSDPFHYVVHADSLLSVDEIAEHLRLCREIAIEKSRGLPPDYFGSDYREPATRLSDDERDSLFDAKTVTAAFRTPEIGIDPEALAAAVRDRLESDPRIHCVTRTQIRGVEPGPRSVAVEFESPDGCREIARYDHAVNTLWDGRLAIDRTAGIEPDRPWMYRVKHYLRVRSSAASTVPSTTIVLGPFGDVVNYANGEHYLSWYPSGMRGVSTAVSPPPWPLTLDESTSNEMRRSIFDSLAEIVPDVASFPADDVASAQVKAGIIFAWGRTDIDDVASGLHERHAIGPRSIGRYHTVDTGKLTMAPLFGRMVADRILGRTLAAPTVGVGARRSLS